jgi:hypothetical protein
MKKMTTNDIIIIISAFLTVSGIMGMLWVASEAREPQYPQKTIPEINDNGYIKCLIQNMINNDNPNCIKLKYSRDSAYQTITFYVDSIPYDQFSVAIQENQQDDFSNYLSLIKLCLSIISQDQYYAVERAINEPDREKVNKYLDDKIKKLQAKGY